MRPDRRPLTIEEIQQLMRHSSPRTSMTHYVRTRKERETQIINGLYKSTFGQPCASDVLRKPSQTKNGPDNASEPKKAIGERGFEPPTSASRTQHSSQAELLPGQNTDYSRKKGEGQAVFVAWYLRNCTIFDFEAQSSIECRVSL